MTILRGNAGGGGRKIWARDGRGRENKFNFGHFELEMSVRYK